MDAGIGEREFQKRKAAVLEECKLAPQVFEGVAPRLEQFLQPFVEQLARREQVDHALTLVRGLLSDLENKNVESIAYRFHQARMPLQWFVGVSKWDDRPLRAELAQQIGRDLGDPGGGLVCEPSAFPKSGRESGGA
jgi:SRSO17 transposase